MPNGIFVIEWDRMEGALFTHRHPRDLDVDASDIQKIQISHQLNEGSSWVSIEEELFKVVSFYNASLERSLVISLKPYEDASDFVPVLVELARVLIPLHDQVSDEEFDERLKNDFEVVQTVVSTSELVMLGFSTELQAAKDQLADLTQRMDAIIPVVRDPASKILLHLLKHERATVGELEDVCTDEAGRGRMAFQAALLDLLERNVLLFSSEDRSYQINLTVARKKKIEEIVLF